MTNRQELLNKLKALAEQGVGGEKINAQKKLKELMQKYNISDEDLFEEDTSEYEFTYHGEREKNLLHQIIYKVTNSTEIYSYTYTASNRKCKTKIGKVTTKTQKIEIEFLFDFYKRLYKKEEELFYKAFIQKHKLFGTTSKADPKEIDYEELKRMFDLMDCMTDETPLKQIPQNT